MQQLGNNLIWRMAAVFVYELRVRTQELRFQESRSCLNAAVSTSVSSWRKKGTILVFRKTKNNEKNYSFIEDNFIISYQLANIYCENYILLEYDAVLIDNLVPDKKVLNTAS